MRELLTSFFSFSLACSLFGLKQIENLLTPTARGEDKEPATKAFDSVTNAFVDQFEETLTSTFRALDNTQRGMVSLLCSFFGTSPSTRKEPEPDSAEPRAVTDINWKSEPAAGTKATPIDLRTGTY
jgi:hypothetical protein